MLVARPDNNGVSAYVQRARQFKEREEVERLYILSKEDQKFFARQVVREINNLNVYKIDSYFKISKDYRYNLGGFGALMVLKS